MTTKYKIEAPHRSFTGESVGVHFHEGTGYVTDGDKAGRAALEYFRRHGYGVAPADEQTEEETVQDLVTGTPTPFDPAMHDAPEVIAYLDSLGAGDSDAEFASVLAAERDGKARKTILARGEQKKENGQ